MRRRSTSAVVLAAMAMALAVLGRIAPPARAAVAACPVAAADQAVDAQEQQFLTLINQYRVANGHSALTIDVDATRAASWFSRDMADKNYLPPDHVDTNGRGIPDRLTWCGAHWNAYAENIYAGGQNAQDAFDWWRNSPTHNTNMLRDTVTVAGIAKAFNASSTYGWYWTLDLTTPAAPTISGSSWYSDGTNAKSGGAGATVRAYAVGAFQSTPYQLVLGTAGCASTVAVLNASVRFANTSGFISQTVGTIPSGLSPGAYKVCFKASVDVAAPTATGVLTFTLS